MRRNIHYKPSKSASILSGVIACAMGVFGLFTIPSIGAMIGFKAIWCLMTFGMGIFRALRCVDGKAERFKILRALHILERGADHDRRVTGFAAAVQERG